jgi:hypothetical protein
LNSLAQGDAKPIVGFTENIDKKVLERSASSKAAGRAGFLALFWHPKSAKFQELVSGLQLGGYDGEIYANGKDCSHYDDFNFFHGGCCMVTNQ